MAADGSVATPVTIGTVERSFPPFQGELVLTPSRGFGPYEPVERAAESEAERLTRMTRECSTP